MSNASKQRLIRAVRLLPGAVRIGRGTVEDIDPGEDSTAFAAKDSAGKPEESALVIAEAEIAKLKSELRDRESELAMTRTSLKSVETEIKALKDDLQAERTRLYDTAAKEAAERKEAAFREGHEEGHAQGYADGMAKAETDLRSEYEGKFSQTLLLLEQINQSLQAAREKLAEAHLPQLLHLWEIMLQRMLQVRVDLDPETVNRVLVNILSRVSDREKIMIYLNPADIASIEGNKENLMDSVRGVKFFELLSDTHVDKGSCLIETNLGIYDARWKTQLEQISNEVQSLVMESIASDEPDND